MNSIKGINTNKMNHRERVLLTINHKQPDHPPAFATLTPQMAKMLSDYMGLPYEEPIDSLLSTRISHTGLLTKLGNDLIGVAACYPDTYPTKVLEDGTLRNEWGMQFKDSGLYNEFYKYPLDHAVAVREIIDYPFPEVEAHGRFDFSSKQITKYKTDYPIIGDLETSIFETAWYLVGLEKFLIDMIMENKYIDSLLDKIMDINIGIGKKLIQLGVDIIWCGDDFGSQHGMIMDPENWRSVFKPRIGHMFKEFRRINPEIKIAWHSCGSILPIIPDFIELGLDILNPLQPLAQGMKPEFLKSEYGKDLVFFGGIDVQELLPNASADAVKKEVIRVCQIYGEGGGFIAAPAHNIQPDTPVANVLAMYEGIRESFD
ncbi:uroporphyrinogen decarboxylase family protein [Bacteroidota bacterium]